MGGGAASGDPEGWSSDSLLTTTTWRRQSKVTAAPGVLNPGSCESGCLRRTPMCDVLCLPYLRENGVGAALSTVSPVRKNPGACDESSGPCVEEAPPGS